MQPENEAIVSDLGALHRIVKNSAGAAAASIEEEAIPSVVATSAENQLQSPRSQDEQKEAEKAVVERDGKTPWFRNVKTIRFLISQILSSITPFLQGLARSLISRRSANLLHKQHAFKIAEATSESMYDHMTWERLGAAELFKVNSLCPVTHLPQLLILSLEKGSGQVITIALVTFKQNNGIKAVIDILGTFWVKFRIYLLLDSPQTVALQTLERSSDTPRLDFFNPHQFFVELRASILSVVRNVWSASSIEKASCSIVSSVIEILGIVLKVDSESGAFTRKELEKYGRLSNTISWRTMEPNEEGIRQLVEMGFTWENAMARILRGNGNVTTATEWLTSQGVRTPQRGNQISASSSRPLIAESHSTGEEGTDVDVAREEPIVLAQSEGAVERGAAATEPIMPPPHRLRPPSISGLFRLMMLPPPSGEPQASESGEISPSAVEKGKAKEGKKVEPPQVITIEELDELRSAICESLIDRSLDVLGVHSAVTFELSSLLTSAFGEGLPLAVDRVPVLPSRKQELAIRMAKEDNLRSLFYMLRCKAGLKTERIQLSIILVLRYIIEDKEVLRAIMGNEIRTWFQSRGSRRIGTQSYVRHSHHLALRDPDAFVELNALNLKPNRSQKLDLTRQKETEEPDKETEEKEMVDRPKPAAEVKPPGLENLDGVIHFLLSELLAKDAIDNHLSPNRPKENIASVPMDVQMEQGESTGKSTEVSQAMSFPKPEKPGFKAEQHPKFIYRCFILQALTELLSCYNRAKIEFIGFSRKAAPREAITPSKPRSAVLNYLINDIIPPGTLIHTGDVAHKKRATTSQWAILAIVSLSAQTGESSSAEDESNLLFVRKFILESALKAFEDASSSLEPLDAKYSRIMSLTDLFFRMPSARPNHNHSPGSAPSKKSQQQIARIMIEKNFIAASIGSLADIGLNFPSARRVIKYILRPLKLLSKTAIELNEIFSISTPGATDKDEISTATSISDIGDMREDTPDLYRNPTLRMFEGEIVDDEHSS
ncbi:hypothetical protein B9Z19DRAFT_1062939 [Tuber borchii]|uniref:UBA domain-containing protein n=1 Tax=Tuber borchii TaxID=42251 RepID=A0A2T7A004_TUBBO|nr:hypothetical protein B9Z19DRAFT_1062939 [Tuber borchii]